MGDKTGIEWTDATWNPVAGCSIVSPGCKNCYAMAMANRLLDKPGSHYEGTTKKVKGKAVWTGKITFAPERILKQPLRWSRPRMIFVNSMSDLFHEDVPFDFIETIWDIMFDCPQHTFQILTKRPERMLEFSEYMKNQHRNMAYHNVWLGTSIEDQARADERIKYLIDTPAAVRFLSMEPLLGHVNVKKWLPGCSECSGVCGWRSEETDYPDEERCNDCGARFKSDSPEEFCNECNAQDFSFVCPQCDSNIVNSHPETDCIDWIILGGESGPGARPMHEDWATSIRDQAVDAGVPFFFKQWGEWHPLPAPLPFANKQYDVKSGSVKIGKKNAGRVLVGRTWDQIPACAGEESDKKC